MASTYSPQPNPSSRVVPVFIDSSKPDIRYPYNPVDQNTMPFTGHGISRPSSPTPSEREELKVFDGTIRNMFRKESWKDKDFISTYRWHTAPDERANDAFQSQLLY